MVSYFLTTRSASFQHLLPHNLQTVDEVMSDGGTSKILHTLSEEGTKKGLHVFWHVLGSIGSDLFFLEFFNT
jgi:hypothetical protein